MFLQTLSSKDPYSRMYSFKHAYEAEEFAELHNGYARAGQDEYGRWIALI